MNGAPAYRHRNTSSQYKTIRASAQYARDPIWYLVLGLVRLLWRAVKRMTFAMISIPIEISINHFRGKLRGSTKAEVHMPSTIAISRIAIFAFIECGL